MPKQKKQPKNAYYFFIMDKKKEYERQGTRFQGIRDLFAMENLREEWKALDPQARAKYDHLSKAAKAADKLDLTNKFTCAGESYAQVQQRQNQHKMEDELLEEILAIATEEGPALNSRHFVIFKSIYMAEVGYPPNMEYWPAELAVASFKLETGFVSCWWTLVDVVQLPSGYASAAKDTQEMTGLLLPGSYKYKESHRDYFKILNNIKRFVERYVEPHNGYYIVFVKPDDEKQIDQGVLNWLLKHARYETRDLAAEYEDFVKSIKLIRVTKLLLKLAGVARRRTPSYQPPVAVYDFLEQAAGHILAAGDWDYKETITCPFHNLDETCNRAQLCCRNIVLRTIFLILRELVTSPLTPMQIPLMSTHYVACIKPMEAYQLAPPPMAPPPPKFDEAEGFSEALDADWAKIKMQEMEEDYPRASAMDSNFRRDAPQRTTNLASGAASFGKAAGGASTSAHLANAWGVKPPPSSFTNDDFPALGSNGRGGGDSTNGVGPGNGVGGFPSGSTSFAGRGGGGLGMGRGRGVRPAGNTGGGDGGWTFEDENPAPAPGFMKELHEEVTPNSDSMFNSWNMDGGEEKPDAGFKGQGAGRGRGGW